MPGPNETRSPGRRIVSYGKYAGFRYKSVPTEYLRWVVSEAFKGQSAKQGQDAARIRWAREELERREKNHLKKLEKIEAVKLVITTEVNHQGNILRVIDEERLTLFVKRFLPELTLEEVLEEMD